MALGESWNALGRDRYRACLMSTADRRQSGLAPPPGAGASPSARQRRPKVQRPVRTTSSGQKLMKPDELPRQPRHMRSARMVLRAPAQATVSLACSGWRHWLCWPGHASPTPRPGPVPANGIERLQPALASGGLWAPWPAARVPSPAPRCIAPTLTLEISFANAPGADVIGCAGDRARGRLAGKPRPPSSAGTGTIRAWFRPGAGFARPSLRPAQAWHVSFLVPCAQSRAERPNEPEPPTDLIYWADPAIALWLIIKSGAMAAADSKRVGHQGLRWRFVSPCGVSGAPYHLHRRAGQPPRRAPR